MDSGVRWQGFDAQIGFDRLLRTPEQMLPKIPPLNRRERQSGSWIAENYASTGRAKIKAARAEFARAASVSLLTGVLVLLVHGRQAGGILVQLGCRGDGAEGSVAAARFGR